MQSLIGFFCTNNCQIDEYRSKLAAIDSRSGGTSERSALLQKEFSDAKRKCEEANRWAESLRRQIEAQKSEMRDKEAKWKEEMTEKLETCSKKVRAEVHHELQALREECTAQRNRASELASRRA